MNKRIFLDTNILIDFLDDDRAYHNKAKESFLKIIEDGYVVYISEDMINTIYYVLKGNSKVLLFFKEILDVWSVVSFGKDIIKEAIEFSIGNSVDLEDGMQCFCAKKYNCVLLTNDKKFVDCGVSIVSYDKFLER